VISDFGIAIVISAHSQTAREVVGTISYMAPEQLNGKPGISSDQYAPGVVAYEWLCGECPFQGSLGEVAAQHMNSPPPSLCEQVPGLPSTIEEVVFKALAKDPVQRYPSILDFFYAFEYAIQPQPLQLRAPVEDKDNPDDAHNALESRTIQVLDSATAAPSIPMEPIMLL
jgi:serine/threonine protein kinase